MKTGMRRSSGWVCGRKNWSLDGQARDSEGERIVSGGNDDGEREKSVNASSQQTAATNGWAMASRHASLNLLPRSNTSQ